MSSISSQHAMSSLWLYTFGEFCLFLTSCFIVFNLWFLRNLLQWCNFHCANLLCSQTGMFSFIDINSETISALHQFWFNVLSPTMLLSNFSTTLHHFGHHFTVSTIGESTHTKWVERNTSSTYFFHFTSMRTFGYTQQLSYDDPLFEEN